MSLVMILTFILFVLGLIIAVGGLYVVMNDKDVNKFITKVDVRVIRLSGAIIAIVGVLMMFMRCM
jgi:hypothetical protein